MENIIQETTIDNPKSETKFDSKFPNFGKIFSESWNIYQSNINKFVTIGIFIVLIYLLLKVITLNNNFIASLIDRHSDNTVIFIIQIIAILVYGGIVIFFYFALIYWQTFSVLYIIKNREHNPSPILSIKYGISQTFKAMWTNIIKAIIVFGGNLLAGIPGFIISIRTIFSDISMVYNENYGFQALSTSRYYVMNKWWTITFYVITIGSILGLIYGAEDTANNFIQELNTSHFLALIVEHAFIFIYALTSPFALIFLSFIYENLQNAKPEPSQEIIKKDRKILIWYLVSSLLATIAITIFFIGIIWYIIMPYATTNKFLTENNPSSETNIMNENETENDLSLPTQNSDLDKKLDNSVANIKEFMENYHQEYKYYPYTDKTIELIANRISIPSECGKLNSTNDLCGINYYWVSSDVYRLETNYITKIDTSHTFSPK